MDSRCSACERRKRCDPDMAKRKREAGGVGAREIVLGSAFLSLTIFVFGLGIWVGRSLGVPQAPAPTQIVRGDAPVRPADDRIEKPVGRELYDDHRKAIEQRLVVDAESTAQVDADSAATMDRATATATKRAVSPVIPTATRRIPPTLRPTASPTARVAATPAAPPTQRPATGRWVVYVGETQREQQAFDWNGDLRQRGMTATTDQRTEHGVRIYRVRVGPFATRDEATSVAQRLLQTGKYPDAFAAPR